MAREIDFVVGSDRIVSNGDVAIKLVPMPWLLCVIFMEFHFMLRLHLVR